VDAKTDRFHSAAWAFSHLPSSLILGNIPTILTRFLSPIIVPIPIMSSAPEQFAAADVSAQLVAVAAAFGWPSGPVVSRRTTGSLNSSSHRLHTVLDSLASICVRKGAGEIYAVAMQVDENKGKFTVTIAGNKGVPPAVVAHLESVLGQLEGIADAYHRFYKEKGKKYPIEYREESPDPHEAMVASTQLVAELKESIYRHSLEKFTARIDKRYKEFTAFMVKLEQHMDAASDDSKDSVTWENLSDAQHLLNLVSHTIRDPIVDYRKLVTIMDSLNGLIRELVKSMNVIAGWPHAVKGKLHS
jgi:hypothetical protein